MRPAGEIRTTLLSTIERGGPMTQRDAAERAHVGYEAARICLQNAARSGAVQIVGREKRPHCDKWVALYDVPRAAAPASCLTFLDLGNAIAQWLAR